jgi:type IV pilus assembly protein PilV
MNRRNPSAHSRGFSLVEVMVAVIVICVGLLGIAKMQALSVGNTTTARLRSLAALQAASLASAMHSNRDYWATTPPATVTVTGNPGAAPTIASSDGMGAVATTDVGAWPGDPQNCVNTSCVPLNLAGFDVAWWATSLSALLPNPTATVTCTPTPPAACTIVISWTENAIASNASEVNTPDAGATTGNQFQNPTYTLYVEP